MRRKLIVAMLLTLAGSTILGTSACSAQSKFTYFDRGKAYYAEREYDRSSDEYTKAIRLDPKYTAAYINRGNCWERKGEYGKAIEDYTKAIRLNSKSAMAYCNRGLAWSNKGEPKKAIEDFTQAIRLNPTNPVPTITMAEGNAGMT